MLSISLAIAFAVFASTSTLAAIPGVPSWIAQTGVPGPFSVSTAGDVNGDGFSDLIVGAPSWSDEPASAPNKGRVFVYLGSASGLSAQPDWEASGSAEGTLFGSAVSTAGDLDGDGFDDILIAARGLSDGVASEGGIFVWLGSADFASAPSGTPENADWRAESGQAGSDFGCSVANAGDLNGDGFADLVVGARFYDVPGPGANEGAAFVWLGGANFAARTDGEPGNADWLAFGSPNASDGAPNDGSQLGFAVSGAGDVNGDGYDDLLVSAPHYTQLNSAEFRRVMLWRGEPDFADDANDGTTANADWHVGSFVLGYTTTIGFDVRRAGDVDGDGLADVVIGGPDEVGWFGYSQAWVFRGNATTLLESGAAAFLLRDGFLHMGASISTAGDVNGDGRADLIVGEPQFPPTVPPASVGSRGAATVHLGSAATTLDTTPYATLIGFADGAQMGGSVNAAGDVNGDGFGDVVIAGIGTAGGAEARVYLGSGDSVGAAPGFATTGFPATSRAGLGLGAGGDLNGDGFGDYLIGAPFQDGGATDEGAFQPVYGGSCGPACGPPAATLNEWNGAQASERFGASVAGAGDVNGDGFEDAVVGAPGYDRSDPPQATLVDAGRLALFLGTASGLAPSPVLEREGSEAGAQLGASIANAGDVNGDGLSDVVVGEPFADAPGHTDAGRVSLYLGRPAPVYLSPTPAWVVSGTRTGGRFGFDVASAGDVDRDGRSDVIIGEERGGALGLGAAHLFLGNPSGLSLEARLNFENEDSGGASANVSGISVSSAGDVNRDGYADVVVGFPDYVPAGGGSSHDGRIRVYLGGGEGPLPPLLDAVPDSEVLGEAGMRLGASVSGGGDFDGDGFSDVAASAPAFSDDGIAEGGVFVFHGSASGVSGSLAAVLSDTPGESADFGGSLVSNLDTNGDGFADLVIGASSADAPLSDSGNSFVHFGNGHAGVPRLFRQTDAAANPIALLGTTSEPSSAGFGIRIVSPGSPAGRVARAIETQAAPLGVAFADGESRSTPFSDPGPVPTVFDVDHQCPDARPCRWRARVVSDSPFFPRSPWLSPAGNAALEADLRSVFDGDGDGVSEQADNCPFIANADQSDAGGIGSTLRDGIGDPCQCGDPVANGIVQNVDVAALRAAFAGLTTPAVTDDEKCNVIGSRIASDGSDIDTLRDDCNLVDVTVLRRRLAGLPEPSNLQECAAAQ